MSPHRLSDIFMTTGQVAKALSVNRVTVNRWVNSGVLSGERVGPVTLIPKNEVRELAVSRCVAGLLGQVPEI